MNYATLWKMLGWVWIATVVWLSLTPVPPQPLEFDASDKLEHATAYALLTLWFCPLYLDCARFRMGAWLVGLGVSMEILQGLSGYRYFEFADMVANTTGVLLGSWLASRPLRRLNDSLSDFLKQTGNP